MPERDFESELKSRALDIDALICGYLPEAEGEAGTLLSAVNYAVRDGGKRVRPLLMESAYILVREALGDSHGPDMRLGPEDRARLGPFMAAMEMMHSASLVHDDLPCMDDDDLRRGKASTWAKYGEDMGVLAGDALMIYTFETALKSEAEPGRLLDALKILSQKSGIYGMTGGQSVDVELTGRAPGEAGLIYIYEHKTACLIEASLMIGGVLAGADRDTVDRLKEAGSYLGLAFQIEDDILDIVGNVALLGKPLHSDEELNKTTWVDMYGMDRARADVREYTGAALRIIGEIGDYPFLTGLIEYLAGRKY